MIRSYNGIGAEFFDDLKGIRKINRLGVMTGIMMFLNFQKIIVLLQLLKILLKLF